MNGFFKVDAKGTMYHNQVAFYYYKQGNDDAALNKLCIVGMKVYPNADIDPDYSETQYHFGVYENICSYLLHKPSEVYKNSSIY